MFFRLETILAGLLLAVIGALVQYSRDSGWEYAPDLQHHYGFQDIFLGKESVPLDNGIAV